MREPRHHKELNAASAESGDTLAVMLTTGKLNLNLVSITLGMMVLGVSLKARYQSGQGKARGRVSGGDSA